MWPGPVLVTEEDEMNFRKSVLFGLYRLRGQALGAYYERFLREYRSGIPPDTTKKLLIRMLSHCRQSVPYYAEVMRDLGDSFYDDPEEYLRNFPVLTKDTIRSHWEGLKSADLGHRRWYLNSTGGSTGEPVQFIQDWEYSARSGAISLLFSKLVGREIGECQVYLWGSERDIIDGSEGWKARLINRLTNTTFLNAYRMTPERMREFIAMLNARRPKLIVAYAEAIYELARFSEREGLELVPQSAVITSAVTLYPFMRDTIERVFQCTVFNRYGSREVGDVACEHPQGEDLWVAPWGNYVEIVDGEGNRVPDGTEGEILVTSLTNFAMPFVRYRIEDCGILSPLGSHDGGWCGQVFEAVLGKTLNMFKTRNGTFVEPGYFESMMYFRDWVRRFQVVQKDYDSIVFRIVRSGSECEPAELEEISAGAKLVMGNNCEVSFQFVDEISASGSGKYRTAISEVNT
jgi:phenylacetate-CoA ligase